MATTLIVPIIDLVLTNRRELSIALRTKVKWKQRVRVSASYLLRIRIDDRYLLVRGSRYRSQAQPVGGVYKYLKSAEKVLSGFSAVSDDLIPIDSVSKADLRVKIPATNVTKFIKWFESRDDREYGFWREFYEELVEPGYLRQVDFPYVTGTFVRQKRLFRFSEFAQCYELLIADVFETDLTERQRDLIKQAVSDHPDELFLATADQIHRRGAVPGKASQLLDIPPTAQWTL
ncbi:hypothetical protein [Actinokineospora sp. UTMC 2448]|uniref:SMODS-associated NUDIX domain-containing protein n=1 Tax=Actinokineospora sp. UTMC 2448 TaxID=2268449 RepID=UPI002164A96D|nr:hypothetical protein [Actinokineospora sp. UTMC 2448]